MSSDDLTIVAVGVFQLLFGIWLGWLRWGRCHHEWVEHWWGFTHYLECGKCGKATE